MTLLRLSADFAPLLHHPVFAPLAAPAATPAATPAVALGAALGGPAGPLFAPASPVPAALTVTVYTGAAPLFDDAPKLVSGRTLASTFAPTPGPTPTWTSAPTSAIFTASGAVIPFGDTGLAVLRSEIFHHRLQLVRLRFFFLGVF